MNTSLTWKGNGKTDASLVTVSTLCLCTRDKRFHIEYSFTILKSGGRDNNLHNPDI